MFCYVIYWVILFEVWPEYDFLVKTFHDDFYFIHWVYQCQSIIVTQGYSLLRFFFLLFFFRLIDGTAITTSDEHMWLVPFTPGRPHILTITFPDTVLISGLRIWNYNKSPEDTYRGVSTFHLLNFLVIKICCASVLLLIASLVVKAYILRHCARLISESKNHPKGLVLFTFKTSLWLKFVVHLYFCWSPVLLSRLIFLDIARGWLVKVKIIQRG